METLKQSKKLAHIEALTQNVIGLAIAIAIAFTVMKIVGVQTSHVLTIQVTLFVLSYIRSYYIRRFFNWLLHKGVKWKNQNC